MSELDQWLHDQHEALVDAIRDSLDIEAGLAEVLSKEQDERDGH
ncbi:hypothetical protein [Nocardia xishanensis]|nr:hypothetical protein [Nocardia xishanensis]